MGGISGINRVVKQQLAGARERQRYRSLLVGKRLGDGALTCVSPPHNGVLGVFGASRNNPGCRGESTPK